MREITVGDIKITVIPKKIKNMYIRVLPPAGAVQITAPLFVGDETIRMFAASKLTWVEKQRRRLAAQAPQPDRQYVTGESCYVWGRRYCLDVQDSTARNTVYLSGNRLVMQVRSGYTAGQREAVLNEWYRAQLKQAIPDVLATCERVVGVKAAEWHVKNMRTKWGTCNVLQRRIWLNLQLAKKAPVCLEYVVTHELVHLLERNHKARFRMYMDQFFPDWRTVHEILNRQPEFTEESG